MLDWPTPSSHIKLLQFLSFANFYHRFIRNYSKVAAPLTSLTSTSKPFCWTPEAVSAFLKFKALYTNTPVLAHPDPSGQFIVEVDASDTGVSTVLSQRCSHDQKCHPCAFFSRCLSLAEVNYDVGNRELLAVVLALQEWRHWLEGAEIPFLVWTDHKNLSYIRSTKRLNPRQARWALFLSRFTFTLSYCPGSQNTKPDAFSKQFSLEIIPSDPEEIIAPSCIVGAATWSIEVREAQTTHLSLSNCPTDPAPQHLRSPVLQWGHSSKQTCHPGIKHTRHFLQQRFWWPNIASDVQEFVNACSVCAHNKSSHRPPTRDLLPLPIPHRPWSHIAVDFVSGLPPSEGNFVILTIVDHFSKCVHWVPLPNLPSALETTNHLDSHVSSYMAYLRALSQTEDPSLPLKCGQHSANPLELPPVYPRVTIPNQTVKQSEPIRAWRQRCSASLPNTPLSRVPIWHGSNTPITPSPVQLQATSIASTANTYTISYTGLKGKTLQF